MLHSHSVVQPSAELNVASKKSGTDHWTKVTSLVSFEYAFYATGEFKHVIGAFI